MIDAAVRPSASAAVPANWRSAIAAIPKRYQDAALASALADRTRLERQPSHSTSDVERRALIDTTALCGLIACAYVPWHLADEPTLRDSVEDALRTQDSVAARRLLAERRASADQVLVLGDAVPLGALTDALDAMAATRPILWLVAGPGPAVAGTLVDYGRERDMGRFFVKTLGSKAIDPWSQLAQPEAERRVEQLFAAHPPNRVLVIEPIRSPVTQTALDAAQRLGIPVTRHSHAPARAPAP